MESLLSRCCGHIRIAYVKVYPGEGIAAAAERMGLNADPACYDEVTREQAIARLTRLLHKDMAHESELMPLIDAERLSMDLLSNLPHQPVFYSNGDLVNVGWNPATKSTFDSGIIAMVGGFAFGIWLEDED